MTVLPVIYEDEALLVVNKPPGIVVNRALSVQVPTVADWADAYLYLPARTESVHTASADSPVTDMTQLYKDRSGIAHRIDKETSGCLLIAKSPEVLEALLAMFRDHTIHKTYLAVVHGRLVPKEGEIKAPVGRLPWSHERFGILPGGKESVTEYRVINTFERVQMRPGHAHANEAYSVVTCFPQTGRTHQIRVHLKYINHPIVGDYLYAGRKTARLDRLWAPRVMLHAWKLSFKHPTRGISIAIEAPIPDDMNTVIANR